MSKIILPKSGLWQGIGITDVDKDLFGAFNIDLDRRIGYILPSDRLIQETNSGVVGFTDLGLVNAFIQNNYDVDLRNYAACDTGSIFVEASGTWSEQQDVAGATSISDLVNFDSDNDGTGEMMYSWNTNVGEKDGATYDDDWWTTVASGSALATGSPHPLDVFLAQLCIGDDNILKTWDNVSADNAALTLPEDFQIEWLRNNGNYQLIGTSSKSRSQAFMFVWNGTATQPNYFFGIGAEEALGGVVDNEQAYVLTIDGRLLRVSMNDFTFSVIAFFPNYGHNINLSMTQRGIQKINGLIYMNVQFVVSTTENISLRMLDGIWCYNPVTGTLNHKYALGQFQSDASTNQDDFGQADLAGVGALLDLGVGIAGDFLASAQVYTDYSSTEFAIYTSQEANSTNRSYVITPKIQITDHRQLFQKLLLVLGRFEDNDRVIIRFRTDEDQRYPSIFNQDIINSTTLTCTNTDNVQVDDEVEILAGNNAGNIRTISAVTANTSITLSEALLSGTTSTISYRVMNWRETGSVADPGGSATTKENLFRILRRAHWIQYKIEARAGGDQTPGIQSLITTLSDLSRK